MSEIVDALPVDYETPRSERVPLGNPLLEVRDLQTYFPIKRGVFSRTVGYVKAVDGVSFDVHAGKTLGLVGESGCGKTTVGRTILRLIPQTGGTVRYRLLGLPTYLAWRTVEVAASLAR